MLLLHGCCHNPSGIDPAPGHWQTFSRLCLEKRLIPFIDMAYQGFGDGVDEDAAGLRLMAAEQECMLIASSCSKNMGLYCERTGSATVLASGPAPLPGIRQALERIARANYSMPPDHGAAVATLLFENPDDWLGELEHCRQRVAGIRRELADHLLALQAPASFQSLRRQKGMFSLLPLEPAQMLRLREEFAVYGTAGGRINIAGLAPHQVAPLARALAAVAGD